MLELAMAGSPEGPAAASFEQSLRSFEAALADLPPDVVTGPAVASWAVALGVTLPCTVQELKRAFRRLAFATHPDRPGGSHDAFLRAQAALQDALSSLRAAPPPARLAGAGRYAKQAALAPRRTPAQSTYA